MTSQQQNDPTRPTGRIDRRRLILGGGAAAAVAAISSSGNVVRSLESSIDGFAEASELPVRLDAPDPIPAGGFELGNLYVSLYGHPGSRTLGALGEQGVDETVERVRRVAAEYEGLGRPVIPTFEIIGSVASEFPGSDGDYSNEFGAEKFLPLIDAAQRNGFHVIIDLQSGRSPFSDQVREYEQVLSFPHVSLALDPEWRVEFGRPGGGRIGTVDAAEVNATIAWLDGVIQRKNLPPKMVVLHQFRPSMITDKAEIRTTVNCQVVMHMDGFGSLTLKRGSWSRMVADLPPNSLTGWKNFYDEDRPTPTARQTLDNDPTPMLVTYQ